MGALKSGARHVSGQAFFRNCQPAAGGWGNSPRLIAIGFAPPLDNNASCSTLDFKQLKADFRPAGPFGSCLAITKTNSRRTAGSYQRADVAELADALASGASGH